ncbi:hypothetical protein PILCRDRAFT_360777 [Piloderma croceum F 1598]|uniref:Uncharacterized protein n=1 Tax=Piloderma croceum (strain F 1598) TaxID=765440 RepID=A0A0C3G033_PILCF|nr:hypothetical protein PILCRDRAFT_360777 [Piloderma croceum F 1598]
MDASPASPTTSSHKRLSLVLRFGPLVNTDIPSDIAVETKRKIGNTDNSPPADTEPPRQASPTVRIRRNPSASSPTLSSFLGLKTTPASDIPASSKETRTRLAKPKKARRLSVVLSQMNTPDSGSSELEIEGTNMPSEFAGVKGLPDTSSTSLHTQCESISSTGQLQRVKDLVRPHIALPGLSTNKSKISRHEKDGSISNTSSVQRNSLSGSSPSLRVPMDFGEPSATPISPLAAGAGQSIVLDSLPKATPLPSPTSNTASTSRKAIAQQRRRMSFDFASLKQPRPSPSSLNPMQMQRSQSLFRQQKGSVDSEPTKFADIKADLHEPMSERQRALNVKRARKMAQVSSSHNINWSLVSRLTNQTRFSELNHQRHCTRSLLGMTKRKKTVWLHRLRKGWWTRWQTSFHHPNYQLQVHAVA